MSEFPDNLNTAVFTTNSVFLGDESIKWVFHHFEDGSWEFYGEGNHDEKELMVISLEEIIKIDKSILDISNLPLGFKAFRPTLGSKWEVSQIV